MRLGSPSWLFVSTIGRVTGCEGDDHYFVTLELENAQGKRTTISLNAGDILTFKEGK